jgi:hypothetical protein
MKLIRKIIAILRLNKRIVCEESAKIDSMWDFHDYPDDEIGEPWHFIVMTCKRCGKKFVI